MQKNAKRVDPHPVANGPPARPVNVPWPDDDMRNPEPLAIFVNDLLLFDLCKAIGLATQLRMFFDGA